MLAVHALDSIAHYTAGSIFFFGYSLESITNIVYCQTSGKEQSYCIALVGTEVNATKSGWSTYLVNLGYQFHESISYLNLVLKWWRSRFV